jgi:hypothetical protein
MPVTARSQPLCGRWTTCGSCLSPMSIAPNGCGPNRPCLRFPRPSRASAPGAEAAGIGGRV